MEDEIKQICTELNDGQIAVVQATEKLLDLFNVSNSKCKWMKINGVYKKECKIKYTEKE